jgi:hypothetical protein
MDSLRSFLIISRKIACQQKNRGSDFIAISIRSGDERTSGKLSIDFFSMADFQNQYQEDIIVDRIHDSVIANANTMKWIAPRHFRDVWIRRPIGKAIELVADMFSVPLGNFFQCICG